MKQRTIKRPIFCTGIGVHTGMRARVVVSASDENSGLVFFRNIDGKLHEIKACVNNISETRGATVLRSKMATVQTVEHLLAALVGCGIDNARIDIDGPELPIFDGSAQFFVQEIRKAGIKQQQTRRQFISVNKIMTFRLGKAIAVLTPSDTTFFSCWLTVGNKSQFASFSLPHDRFSSEIAPARTFVEKNAVVQMKKIGLLRGADLANGILLNNGIPENTSFRLRNECARHKLLDAIGDFSLLGKHLLAKIELFNTSHTFHHFILKHISAT